MLEDRDERMAMNLDELNELNDLDELNERRWELLREYVRIAMTLKDGTVEEKKNIYLEQAVRRAKRAARGDKLKDDTIYLF